MEAIKEYKPMCILYYKDYDGTVDILVFPKINKPQMLKSLGSEKFITIEGITLNTYNIIKIEDTKNSIEEVYYSQSRERRRHWEKDRPGCGIQMLELYGKGKENPQKIILERINQSVDFYFNKRNNGNPTT